jgi:hypothetical protein
MKEFFFIVGTLHEPNAGRCRVAEHDDWHDVYIVHFVSNGCKHQTY